MGAGVGVLVATQAVEKGETAPADYIGLFAVGGALGGGLLGALVGRAFPTMASAVHSISGGAHR